MSSKEEAVRKWSECFHLLDYLNRVGSAVKPTDNLRNFTVSVHE